MALIILFSRSVWKQRNKCAFYAFLGEIIKNPPKRVIGISKIEYYCSGATLHALSTSLYITRLADSD